LKDESLTFLGFTFVATLPASQANQAPAYDTVYFYLFLIARLSKCFVCVASKLFLLKEQARRKALRILMHSEIHKQEAAAVGNHTLKTFTQMNKKSMAYKRALFIE